MHQCGAISPWLIRFKIDSMFCFLPQANCAFLLFPPTFLEPTLCQNPLADPTMEAIHCLYKAPYNLMYGTILIDSDWI
jgi:hypothetical protein